MTKPRSTSPLPWILFLLLVLSIVAFWILPNQRPASDIRLNYRSAENAPAEPAR